MNSPLSPLVLDANVSLYVLGPLPQHEKAVALVENLLKYERPWYAPSLWRIEVLSGLRKMEAAGMLDGDSLNSLLARFWEWPVQVVGEDRSLLEGALQWARRIEDRVLYDSTYLALADRLGAELWTADRRLYRRSREAGADFVHLFL